MKTSEVDCNGFAGSTRPLRPPQRSNTQSWSALAAVATIVVLTAFPDDIGTAMDQITTNLKATADKTGR